MVDDNIITKTRKGLPEGFWRFVIIGFIIYAFVVVGKVIVDNYNENKTVSNQEKDIDKLKTEISDLQLNIAYYKTDTYKEKIARAKLRYALPGETVVATPYDTIAVQDSKTNSSSAEITRPNIEYWKLYFFGQ
ncbi:MAG: septum formation initiator family protein [Candidatus Berkelbacteria bacterium]|nr:septum formation initiator family protein [Candidatus Berkelbacteria bacterium]